MYNDFGWSIYLGGSFLFNPTIDIFSLSVTWKYHRPLKNIEKSRIAFSLKVSYNDRPHIQVVLNNAIKQQKSDDNCYVGRKYLAGAVCIASINQVLSRRRITRLLVQK